MTISPSVVFITATSLFALTGFFSSLESDLASLGSSLVSFFGSSARAEITPSARVTAHKDMNGFIGGEKMPPTKKQVTPDFTVGLVKAQKFKLQTPNFRETSITNLP